MKPTTTFLYCPANISYAAELELCHDMLYEWPALGCRRLLYCLWPLTCVIHFDLKVASGFRFYDHIIYIFEVFSCHPAAREGVCIVVESIVEQFVY